MCADVSVLSFGLDTRFVFCGLKSVFPALGMKGPYVSLQH